MVFNMIEKTRITAETQRAQRPAENNLSSAALRVLCVSAVNLVFA
jgi:hypothetical protein